ncbi:MAG TPA: family 2 encapsulin nanocompartment cargo protein terpene cyclase [Pseudonocardiaceae bacterium]|jgi:2-methylisoborneol synthase|nr:family 2 encapsulin nanocompartment cargo protein terpene cyclase [Pseudonocardiaceae bacterium]
MSLLTRASAPALTHELADLARAILSNQDHTAPATPGAVADPLPAAVPVLAGPSGLGTSAARPGRPRETQPTQQNDSVPTLYCPPPLRDDPVLGELVNERLVQWAGDCGIYPGHLDELRATNLGRLIMLTHPDTDDPDRLLAAAKCATAEWAVDDHYCDDETAGSDPELLSPRLAVAAAAVDPAYLPIRYAPEQEKAMRDDPVLVALRTAVAHFSDYGSWAQVARLRHEIAAIFVAFGQEAGWRMAGKLPPVWEYLTNRQPNSFLPCMALIDALGGYELPTGVYTQPRVRHAITRAAMASVIVNDLYSMARESRSAGLDFNLPTVIAAEENCSLREGVRRTVDIHDELVHAFEAEAAALTVADPNPALRRFLAGVWAWLGGNHEWHRRSPRYATAAP